MNANEDRIFASALAALPDVGSDDALPADIQVFPPGRGVKFTLQDFPGQQFEIDVDATTADVLNEDLQNRLARASAGKGSMPFADKNHEDAEKTFTPVQYFWAGDDKKAGGVRLKTAWNPYGAALVRAKAFTYFSQNFLFSKAKKKVLGLINENVGGLVNRPGFATQAAFAKAASSTTNINEETMTTEDAKNIGAAITAGLSPLIERVNALVAHAGASTSTATAAADAPAELMGEIVAAQAKGRTFEQAMLEVSSRRPDLCVAYRNAMVFHGGKPVATKAAAPVPETRARAKAGADEYMAEVMAEHAAGTPMDQAAQAVARRRPDLFEAYRGTILRA